MTDRPFNLVNYLPALSMKYVAGSTNDWTINTAVTTAAWTNLGTGVFLFEDQLDIAGWTKEGLTAFFASQYLQRPMPYAATGAVDPVAGGVEILDQVIVSDEPIATTPLVIGIASVGFPTTPDDYMNVKFSQGFDFVQTSNAPMGMTMNDSWNCGSGEPTASGTLYFARLVTIRKDAPGPAANDTGFVPEYRYVASGIATEEPEYVYINRLRRSFELRQS